MSLKIAIITGSTRDARAGKHVTDWFHGQIKDTENVQFDVVDLAEENLPFLNEPGLPSMGNYQLESTKKWSEKISSYDGYVFVTPEYNHGYPATLKNAIDTLYAEWQKKPVAFVGYGVMGAVRSIEQLVPVVAQIGMVPIPNATVNVIESYATVDEHGSIKTEAIKGSGAEKLVTELTWWAKVLQTARNEA